MNIDHRNPRLRRGFAFVALAALLGLAAVGLTQCRLVDDTVTGVDLRSESGLNAKSDCVKQCNNTYKACKKQCDADYKAAKQACNSDKACNKAASAAKKACHQGCVNAKKNCKKNCYNEGAGGIGR